MGNTNILLAIAKAIKEERARVDARRAEADLAAYLAKKAAKRRASSIS